MNDLIKFIEKNGFYFLGIFCIIPFLILAFFIHPVGTHGWDWATQYAGQTVSNLDFWAEQSYWYNNVMGRYSSTLVLSLTRFWFNLSSFKLVPIFTIGLMFWSLFYLIRSILSTLPFSKILLFSTGIFIIYLDQLTGVYEGFYNLSCVLTYQFGGVCLFFLVGIMIRVVTKNTKQSLLNFLLIMFLISLAVGSNEVTLIATNGWLFLLLIGKYFHQRVWSKWIFGLFIFSLICSFAEILAPGNFVRMDLAEDANNLTLTIFLTISVSFFNWIRWFSSTPVLIFAVLYLPFGIQLAKNEINRNFFKYPHFVGFGVVSFHVLSLLLLFWSQGDETLPERLMDLIFWISLPGLLYIWQSLIIIFLEKKWIPNKFKTPNPIRWTLIIFSILILFFDGLKIDKSEEARTTSNYLSIIQTNSNIGNAWLELLNGKAKSYNQQQYEIYKQIKNCSSDTLFLDRPLSNPQIIYDPTYDRKTKGGEPFMGHYFGKDIIVVYK